GERRDGEREVVDDGGLDEMRFGDKLEEISDRSPEFCPRLHIVFDLSELMSCRQAHFLSQTRLRLSTELIICMDSRSCQKTMKLIPARECRFLRSWPTQIRPPLDDG